MLLRHIIFKVMGVVFSSLLLNGCPDSGGGGSTDEVDNIAPMVLGMPSVRPLIDSGNITLGFSETIDTATLVLSGDLAVEGNGGLWSSTASTDDTLTISPNANWTTGAGRTLMVDADDLAGNAMTAITLTYDIYNGTIYFVSSNASDDTGDGLTPGTAMQSITAAIAVATLPPAVVVVNAGNYIVNSDTAGTPTHIVLSEGVSLYGGYNSNFTNRDTTAFASIVTDTSTQVTGNYSQPNKALEVENGAGISSATVVDGFTFNGSSELGADYNTAIFVGGGTPVIRNNIINGGSDSLRTTGIHVAFSSPAVQNNIIDGGAGSDDAFGLYILGSNSLLENNTINGGSALTTIAVTFSGNGTPTLQNNTIHGGEDGSFSYAVYIAGAQNASILNNNIYGGDGSNGSYGIFNVSTTPAIKGNTIHGGSGANGTGIVNNLSSAVIQNNTIFGGSGSNATYGITNGSSDSAIQNNTINGGVGNSAYGVVFNSDAVAIDNNIIYTSGASTAYCLLEEDAAGDPASVRNNNLYACATALYLDYGASRTCGSGATCITSIANLNGLGDTTASDNISIDPALADIDGTDNDIATMDDNDWHFSISSPTTVTTGGLNGEDDGGWGFIDDKDEVSRPGAGNPWSMGAYEP